MLRKIQVVTYTGSDAKYKNAEILTQQSFHDIKSLDEYDINVIDLSDNNMWVNDETGKDKINIIEDLASISKMMSKKSKSEIVVLLPQNCNFNYYKHNGAYKSCELKNMIPELKKKILIKLYEPLGNVDLVYENTRTRIDGETYNSAFYFDGVNAAVKSELSEKAVAINLEGIFLTTLQIESCNQLLVFLKSLDLIEKRQDIPEWFEKIEMFDDYALNEQIRESQIVIENECVKIDTSKAILNKNNHLKSVLYTNGDELVKVVFEILEEMLECNLSEFRDVKKEDFLISCNDKIFIGEIKGIGTNVKSANVSQVDTHYYDYLDNHPDDKDKLKALLVINHQRGKAPKDREPVMQEQIALAERNNSLIIETYTLLKLLEQYRQKALSSIEIQDMFFNSNGLLNICDE